MKTVTEYRIGNFWIIWDRNKIVGYLYSAAQVKEFETNEFLNSLS